MSEPNPPPAEEVVPEATRPSGPRRLWGAVRKNAYLGVAAIAALVVFEVVEFDPPPEIRVDPAAATRLVGDTPKGEFADELQNPNAVQLRVTVREFPAGAQDVVSPDPETDASAQVLSQPVVTTILGVNAAVQQSIRLDEGKLEIDVAVEGTPRLRGAPGKNGIPPISLEHELKVTSRKDKILSDEPERRVHLHARATAVDVEDQPQRTVFTVDGHVFALDVELHRAI